ncbi:uncharacterized protein LOC116957383 [Petromyzon marinus]|uniref:uncharacterized protein LOC116957383 n=1 Tax=Petromyzon marinus TaxID=7757 RepID=UPI003F6F0F13
MFYKHQAYACIYRVAVLMHCAVPAAMGSTVHGSPAGVGRASGSTRTVSVTEGQLAVLECGSDSTGPLRYLYWYKGRAPPQKKLVAYLNSETHANGTGRGEPGQRASIRGRSTLHLGRARRSDSGTYRCEALPMRSRHVVRHEVQLIVTEISFVVASAVNDQTHTPITSVNSLVTPEQTSSTTRMGNNVTDLRGKFHKDLLRKLFPDGTIKSEEILLVVIIILMFLASFPLVVIILKILCKRTKTQEEGRTLKNKDEKNPCLAT